MEKKFNCDICYHKGKEENPCQLLSVVPVSGNCCGYRPNKTIETKNSAVAGIGDVFGQTTLSHSFEIESENYEEFPDMSLDDWNQILFSSVRSNRVMWKKIQNNKLSSQSMRIRLGNLDPIQEMRDE